MFSLAKPSKLIFTLSSLLCYTVPKTINVHAIEWKDTGIQLLEAVSDMTATTVGDSIIIAGGCISGNQFIDGEYPGYYCTEATADTSVFDPVKKTFSSSGQLSGPRYRHTAVELDGKVYVVGGKDANEAYIETVEVYDPNTKTWSVLMNLPQQYYVVDHSAVGYNGMIYVMGGYDGNYTAYNRLYAIDIQNKEITNLPPMNEKKGDAHATIYINEDTGKSSIVIAGGFYHENRFCAPLPSVEMYDFENEKWTMLSNLNEARGDVAIVELNGLVYTIGGETKHENYCNPDVDVTESSASIAVDDVETFDPRLGVSSGWTVMSDLNEYRFRSTAAVWTDDDGKSTVYVFGGQSAYDAVCDCFPVSNRIFSFSDIPTPSAAGGGRGTNKVAIAVGATVASLAVLAIGSFVWVKKVGTKEASPEKNYVDENGPNPNEYGIN